MATKAKEHVSETTCYPADGQLPLEEEEEEDAVDSLGFTIKRGAVDKGLQEMEMRVRDNCYVFFVTGILIDHFFNCFVPKDTGGCRICGEIKGITPLDSVLAMFGDSKCQLGMMLVAGYFHSMKGRGFTPFDAALTLVYLFMYAWYPWLLELVRTLLPDSRLDKAWTYAGFAVPRWFLLCILFPRFLTSSLDLVNGLVARCSSKAGEVMGLVIPWFQIALTLVIGLFWKGETRIFCKSLPDWLDNLVCYHSMQGKGIFLYSTVGMMSFLYLVSFFYADTLVQAAWKSDWALQLSGSWKLPQCCQQLGAPRKLKYSKLIAVIVACLYYLSCWFYNTKRAVGFDGGPAEAMATQDDKSGNLFDADESTVWVIQDFLVQTLQAFMFAVMMSQVPFHLSWFGASTLGAYVNQMIWCWLLLYGGITFLLYRIAGVPPPSSTGAGPTSTGSIWYSTPAVTVGFEPNWGYTTLLFFMELFVVFGVLVSYWFSVALFFHWWTMLPFNLPYWIYTWIKDRVAASYAADAQSQSASKSASGTGAAYAENTPLLTDIATKD